MDHLIINITGITLFTSVHNIGSIFLPINVERLRPSDSGTKLLPQLITVGYVVFGNASIPICSCFSMQLHHPAPIAKYRCTTNTTFIHFLPFTFSLFLPPLFYSIRHLHLCCFRLTFFSLMQIHLPLHKPELFFLPLYVCIYKLIAN